MKRLVGILLLSSALVACGGDDDGGGGGSGVDSDKSFAEISGEDVEAMCQYSNALVNGEQFRQLNCTATGIITVAQDPSADCAAVVDACLADPDSEFEPADCSTAADEPIPDCPDLTVGEFEACIEAQANQIDEAASSLTCSNTPADLEQYAGSPAACTELADDCPEIFGDDTAREINGALSLPMSRARDLSTLR